MKHKLIFVLIVLLFAGSAEAVIDPHPDSIGVWFDITADTNTLEITPYVLFDVYLIISNPTAPIAGWECYLGYDDQTLLKVAEIINGGGIWIPVNHEYMVGLAEPLPAEPATWLLKLTFMLLSPQGSFFMVGPHPNPSFPNDFPIYLNGNDLTQLIELHNATGYGPDDEPNSCAAVNVDLPYVALTRQTWSTVKCLW